MGKNILEYNTVSLIEDDLSVEIIDQTLLPGKVELIRLKKAQEMWDAIYRLQVRGAPAIGVFAAYALYVLATDIAKNSPDADTFYAEFQKTKEYLNSSRPTAVNLSWALERMDKVCREILEKPESTVEKCLQVLHDESCSIQEEDIDMCRRIGECGLQFIKPGDGILTHCNAGQLATSKYGTATAPIYLAHERGYNIRVYADETRPLLQGARLTAFELSSAGIDVTLLCDNMSGALMRSGKVNAVFVGCDRVAANGDVANKIGTSVVATMAKHYGIPFYVCAPSSTIDLNTPTGNDIKIEQRRAEEVTELWYKNRMAPEGINVFNPAFDVTDYDLITAIITENGIFKPER
ncbi:MAG: S-methyl-5-thioribose-1-phosphate isomerase [Lachnospiraceae bacterium]|nr:S-methyl-5-thioribose-1-phosphate isomerase [Lachnospiraceae bacterium]